MRYTPYSVIPLCTPRLTMMKTALLLGTLLLTSLPLAYSEPIKADFSQAIQARDNALQVQRNIMQKIFGINVSYSGALVPKKARRLPFSLTPSGQITRNDPFENVSVHPLTGRAEGITLLSINF
jgi:hypothetical protein